jgi:hypothetical protein
MRIGVAGLLVVVTLVAAACNGGAPTPPPSSSVASVAAAPSTAAPSSRAPSSRPTGPATTGPNVRPGERPPAMPAAAKQHTQEGALAFAGYFIRALDWSIATIDTTSLDAVSAPECKACHSYITELNRLQVEGGRIRGGRITLRSASADPGRRDRPSEYQIVVSYVQDPDYVIRPSSLPAPDGTASKTYRSFVLVRWIATGWQTVELEG